MTQLQQPPPLLPARLFRRRLFRHFVVATALVVASLGLGMAIYMHFEHLGLLDAFLNAAMILGGMGPIEQPQSAGGKFFAGIYALYSGLVFLIAAGLVLAPILQRVMHRFHWSTEDR
ncbi:MAG: hypothetical protein ABI639_08125 [Thermoanaerobaculia bacterium]